MTKIYGSSTEEVTRLMKSGDLTIDVVGIGKMGLPLAALLAREGAKVIGVRRSEEAVREINRGICPIKEEPDLPEILSEVVGDGRLVATTDAEWAAEQSDVIIILVPLLVDDKGRPDLSQIQVACSAASRGIREGDLVIIETTMPPGLTRERIIPMLEEGGLVAGAHFGVVHAPERLMTGRVIRNMYKYPKIVGGIDPKSTDAAAGLYVPFGEVVKVSNMETAELVKVSEGVYRDVNIAYANTLALFCEKHGVDAWEVIGAANHQTSDYCHIHLPGAGVGGHCIPVYPWFIITKGEDYSTNVSLIRSAREINDQMPSHMKHLIDTCITDQGKEKGESSVAVLGLSFRKGVKETRLSPGPALVKLLHEYERVLVNDPLFSEEEIREMGFVPAGLDEALECDCIALVTAHEEYVNRLDDLNSASGRIVDGRNMVPRAAYKVGNLSGRHKQ
jgi:nucleotide sugar dehydrogenase